MKDAPSSRAPLRLAALAVVATWGVWVGGAQAQFQTGGDGRALDANPQVGSNGYNGPSGASFGDYGTYGAYDTSGPYGGYGGYGSFGSFGNNIVTGNTTGGRQFRDSVGYTDPRSFRGGTSGDDFDTFVRGASGTTTSGQQIDNATTIRPFYGSTTVAAPPPGFVQTPGTGSYVPPKLTGFTQDMEDEFAARNAGIDVENTGPGTPGSFYTGGAAQIDPQANVQGQPGDLSRSAADLLASSGFALGPVDGSLAGVGGRRLSPYTMLGRDDRLTNYTNDRLRQLGGELLRGPDGQPLTEEDLQQLRDAEDAAGAGTEGQTNAERLQAFNDAAQPTGSNPANDPILRLLDPSEQSAQYAQLQQRLDRFRQDPFAEQLRPRVDVPGGSDPLPGFGNPDDFEEMDNLPAFEPGDAAPTPQGGNDGGGADAANATPEPTRYDPPVRVESFASGVTSPTLKVLLVEAESLLEKQDYVTAATRYAAAERLVPNQPLMMLGRATAELGGGFYRTASRTLRSAYDRDPALTMARVDATSLLGQDRVTEIAEDLRRLADADPNAVDPLFLLAFLGYGQGNYDQTATLLDLAEQRSGDPFYAAVRKMWALETGPGTPSPTTRPDDVDLSK